jgi:D-amino-acid dehydrogenase
MSARSHPAGNMSRVVVVGAGVIGLACAYSLKKRGHDPIVLDKGEPGGACSKGNTGWVTPSISAPIPAPGLALTSLRWMLRSDSPLYISPRAVPGLARWLWRFWRYCNPRDFIHGLRAVAELNRKTLSAFDELERDGVEFELHRSGILFAFLDERYMRQVLAEFDHYREFGYRMPTPLGGADLRRLEPSLSDSVSAGFLVEEEFHVRPETLVAGYADRLRKMGVEIRTGVEVTGANGARAGDRVRGVETAAGMVEGDEVLVAAGAWSGHVLEPFGVSLPVQAGKGYSITLGDARARLTRPLYLGEARVGGSPFEGATRFAGTMELSGLNDYLDPRRIVGIRAGIGRYLRRPVDDGEGAEWVGMRPLTPDGLPLLGRVPGYRNLSVATGHAMLGVTLAPVTGEAMADLITGTGSAAALAPFDPGRFRW